MKIHRVIGVLAALAATTMLVGAFAPSADARVDSVAIAEQTSDGLDFASKTPTDDPYTAETVVTCNSSSEEDNFCDNLADACAASGGGGSSEPGGGETCSIAEQTSDGLDFASKTPTDDPYTAETVVTCNSSSEEDNFCDNLADACAASGGGGSSEPGGGETCSIRDDAEVKQVKHTPLLTRISP